MTFRTTATVTLDEAETVLAATLFQHALGNAMALGIVIEFVGGLVFLLLLILESRA